MRLPDELIREIGLPVGNDRPGNPRFDRRQHKRQPVTLSRKDQRKQKRQEKKQRHAQFFNKRGPVDSNAETTSDYTFNKNHHLEKDSSSIKSPHQVHRSQNRLKLAEDEASRDERRLRKLAQSNPNFYKLLKQDNLVSSVDEVGDENESEDGRDDQMMRQYAKKLKLKNADKITAAFKNDGLDFLLDVTKSVGVKSSESKSDTAESSSGSSDEDDVGGTDDGGESYFSGEEIGDMDDENMMLSGASASDGDETDDQSIMDQSEMESEQDNYSETDHGVDNNIADSGDDDQPASDAEQPGTKVELCVAAQDTTEKTVYVPPHLRQRPQSKSETYIRLKRQTQGHINRLTENNIETVFRAIEALYQSNPRHDVTEILTELVLNLVCDQANLLESFVIVYACLLSLIYNLIGSDVGATIVQSLVESLDTAYREYSSSKVIASDLSVLSSKKSTNLTALLCHLYNFQVVSQVLLYDLADMFADNLTELDVELLLKIIRSCGPRMRSDDPARLKNIIVLLQEKSTLSNGGSDQLTIRHKFMLEQIYDLKNNKSQKHLAREVADKTDSLKKLLRNMMRQYGNQGHEALRCSLDDIRSVHQKGKWWVVGAAWVGRQSGQQHEPLSSVTERADNELLAMARRLNINTDVRRSIFVILMSSEDYADAFEKLLKLGLRDSQEREIVRMIVFLCGQEKTYNPFYAVLGERLCRFSYNHKITFQYTLWDFLKSINESRTASSPPPPLRKLINLARLYAELIQQFALSLSILKTVDFSQLKPGMSSQSPSIVFLQVLLVQLLLCDSNPSNVLKIFNRVTEEALRHGIAYFLVQWIRKQMQQHPADIASIAKLAKLPDSNLLRERVREVKVSLLTQIQ